ncbi:unnamed protein product [Schistosoma mattheei]|uniref:Uncharacterized protein n=1 Tax=Schistosoma mattheei TaxID=31246 RepID=A0A183PA75_9TREM|nr:unnamed protein product [Schistosoma mattheei]
MLPIISLFIVKLEVDNDYHQRIISYKTECTCPPKQLQSNQHKIFITLLIPIISGYTCTPGTGEILLRSSALNSAEKRVENDITSNSNNEDGNGKHLIKQGIFTSPKWPKSYESGTRCVYRFIADVGEKVHIKFDHFVLSGDMPSCSVDFLDVYIDVASSTLDLDRQAAILVEASSSLSSSSNELHTTTPFSASVYSSVLDKSDLLGRYCGDYLATNSVTFISLHREIVLDFYSELEKVANPWYTTGKSTIFGFNGTFEFINDGKLNNSVFVLLICYTSLMYSV